MGFFVLLREEFLSGNFKKQTLSSHSVKKPRKSQPLLFYSIPRNVVFFLEKKFLATSGSFWEGLCRTKCCLFVCCLLLEKPSCWVCKRVFAHVSKWLRKKAGAINIYIAQSVRKINTCFKWHHFLPFVLQIQYSLVKFELK